MLQVQFVIFEKFRDQLFCLVGEVIDIVVDYVCNCLDVLIFLLYDQNIIRMNGCYNVCVCGLVFVKMIYDFLCDGFVDVVYGGQIGQFGV